MEQMITLMQAVFDRPPIAYNPGQQSLKGWAMYCLRDRGFKVVYAQNADFAIEAKDGSKTYFNVTTHAPNTAPNNAPHTAAAGWIIHNSSTQTVQVVAPPSAGC